LPDFASGFRTRNIVEYDDKGEADRLYQFLQKTLQIDYKPEHLSEEAVGALIESPTSKSSFIYRIVLLTLVVLNAPSLWLNTAWRFDAGYWFTFGVATLGAFIVFVVHHRKHLSIWDSKPLGPGKHGSGVVAYLIMTPLLTLILTPLIMVLYRLILRVGGLYRG